MRPFFTAQWRSLAMLNYRVDPAMLRGLVPRGTELDQWQGETYLSLVGFAFLDTKVLGLPIPFHRNFPEINLRFYVRRVAGGEVRRGVVFIRELVPQAAIAWVARALYNEPYRTVAMRHSTSHSDGSFESLSYGWRASGRWHRLTAAAGGQVRPSLTGSEEEFITEHHWGYTRQRDGGTIEYRVEHPRWSVATADQAALEGDPETTYGPEFGAILREPPTSAFVADGSAVAVYRGVRLPAMGT
jgi:uncharacterized protein YqjF (DUF2071 family)